jgi:hypothetical protein
VDGGSCEKDECRQLKKPTIARPTTARVAFLTLLEYPIANSEIRVILYPPVSAS